MKKPVFSLKDVLELCRNNGSAKNNLTRLVADGYVSRIRKNLYSCISPETGNIIGDKYQIASAITETSFVSHHTAMEYYGVANQVYYEVYVSSKTRFADFTYNGYNYKCVMTKNIANIEVPAMSKEVSISSIERTIVDSLKDMDKIAGIEEVISNIEMMPIVNEQQILSVLAEYNNHFLYQKLGFILENYRNKFHLTDTFFDTCKSKMGKSKRYLTLDMKCDIWNNEWQLMVPGNLYSIKNGEQI